MASSRNVPRTLPKCELIMAISKQAESKVDIDFDFIGCLEQFRARVSAEVSHINVLFPEFTPHDEKNHLTPLLHVADKVLTRTRYEKMNVVELFLLAVGLYGHDWGMAVSGPEREYITSPEMKITENPDLLFLPNEQVSFKSFAKQQGIEHQDHAEVPDAIWREYVRQTHGQRSAMRVRKFFEQMGGGLPGAASRICEAHVLDFEELQRYDLYPPDFGVLSETVNLRAISVYVRLIDLLDLSDHRTPYVLWKFAAPKDSRSKMEWAKHAALNPITCPPHQQGRCILVDGSTEDHEVYAALTDLKLYCEEQLRGCNDILGQMNDRRHMLDLSHIHWRVAARNFEPISIQFEFSRKRMFEILADEIYGGDPYVFLRELLQNSIDAIKMRIEVLIRNNLPTQGLGTIRVSVDHQKDGHAVITWTDDGIGMDEFIVRNYLAIAGKSFYRSDEFKNEGLKMDPISRFGVGILSCFMVADRIEITTRKDPYKPPYSNPLKITIPAVDKQFRIESSLPAETQVGTTVRVFVDGKKLPASQTANSIIWRLLITSQR